MKNPITYLKHLIKDPVTSAAEADERKKKLLPIFIGTAAVLAALTILFVILGVIALGCITLFALIFVVWYFVMILSMISKVKGKFAILTCEKCNTQADLTDKHDEYIRCVSYKIINEKVNVKVDCPKPADNGIISKISASAHADALVEITFACPKCGAKKVFNYKIKTFECLTTESKVRALDAQRIKSELESRVRSVASIYESAETRDSIPFTVHSIHHPNYENRYKIQMVGEDFNGVTVKYHRTIDEMVEGFFVHNDLSGDVISEKKTN